MIDQQAVVRLPYTANKPIRVGTVISQDGSLFVIKWDDGAEEESYLGDFEKVCSRGSLQFQALVEPDALRAGFEADPLAILVQACQEADGPMTGKELKVAVTGYGVDEAIYKRAWLTVRKQLASDARVIVSGAGASTTFAAA
ncbi:hypothetical protein KOI35_32745 [Actinoplanes bogorensis]|uniref:Uncharacterized protein n=1 Tax=Paractinoplanes bogorensis TaxID=1610840 RepID=A0ABS5YXX9_9ACTN|nr:hypothetical protein [Actinoplanes bogorensis]MBU2668291.1 hypothetical protein [Actinoplanes bogorensis]